jgi:hypothetical protein
MQKHTPYSHSIGAREGPWPLLAVAQHTIAPAMAPNCREAGCLCRKRVITHSVVLTAAPAIMPQVSANAMQTVPMGQFTLQPWLSGRLQPCGPACHSKALLPWSKIIGSGPFNQA